MLIAFVHNYLFTFLLSLLTDGCDGLKIGRFCFTFRADTLDFEAASSFSDRLEGVLGNIGSSDTNTKIINYLSALQDSKPYYWVGAKWDQAKRYFVNYKGDEVTYINWADPK